MNIGLKMLCWLGSSRRFMHISIKKTQSFKKRCFFSYGVYSFESIYLSSFQNNFVFITNYTFLNLCLLEIFVVQENIGNSTPAKKL